MQTQQVVFFKEIESKGLDTRYWENYGRRDCANFYMERLCKLHYSQSRVMPGPQQCGSPGVWG
jgi:hypothetical protein